MARLTESKDDGEITAEEFEAANRAGAARRARGVVTSARFFTTGRRLSLRLSTGVTLIVPVDQIEGLFAKPNDALRDVLIGPGGLSVHFPQLDADISAVGLLDGIFGSPSWMALWRGDGRQARDRETLVELGSEIGSDFAAKNSADVARPVETVAPRFHGGDTPPTVHSMPSKGVLTEGALVKLRNIVVETVDEMKREISAAPVDVAASKPRKRGTRSKAKP